MGGQPWTVEEVEKLKELYPKAPIEELLKAFPNRSYNAIQLKAERLGLKRDIGKKIVLNKPKLAYVLGVLMGDGSVYVHKRGYRIELHVRDEEFARSFAEALKALGLNPWIGGPYEPHSGKKPEYKVVAYSKDLAMSYQQMQHLERLKEFLSDNTLFINFLRGFYESEGCLYKPTSYRRLLIYNNNADLLQYICERLQDFGIKASIREYRKGEWCLEIWKKKDIAKFLRLVKPVIKR